MYTRCPKCSTCFRVTERHLAIAKGKVRCGQCQLVFNAPENAIDDLPTKTNSTATSTSPAPPVTRSTKTKTKTPPTPVQKPKVKITKANVTEEKSFKAAETKPGIPDNEEIKPQKATIKKPVIETSKINTSKPGANATLIAKTGILNKHNLDSINIDAHSKHQHSFGDHDDDPFNDSFDLDAAINELDQAAENESHIIIKDEPVATESKKDNSGDIFTTDAYDATSAESVTDILNEMEGQLSLDIEVPDNNGNDDENNELEFIQLDDEPEALVTENKEETNDETLRNHFDFNDVLEEQNELINENEHFDKIDLNNFQDSDISEDIVLEDPHSQDIRQHSPEDENDVPFQLRNDLEYLQTASQRRMHPLLKFTFIIILLALSFSQLAYFRAHELVRLIPSSQPMLEQFCEKVDCHYSGPRDTKQIQLINRDVRLHPKTKKALLISAAMINNAPFAQPYPNIHIRLSDISGNVVAERIFNTKTYMGKISNPFLLMKSKTPVHINFEVIDPGKDAINFEFTFL